jgi:hypothetical protein
VKCFIDEVFDEIAIFFDFCVFGGIMRRIFVRHLIAHDDPTTSLFPSPGEAVTPDSEISTFALIIIKEADALVLFLSTLPLRPGLNP